MKTTNQFKTMAIMAIVMFVLSVLGCIYISLAFLGFTGCSIGLFAGAYNKEKKKLKISKRDFYALIGIVSTTLLVSGIIYYILKEKSIYYILPLNGIMLLFAIWFIVKKQQKPEDGTQE